MDLVRPGIDRYDMDLHTVSERAEDHLVFFKACHAATIAAIAGRMTSTTTPAMT